MLRTGHYKENVKAASQATKQDPKWLRTWYWPLYILFALLAFAIPETYAIIHKGEGGTKSEWVREKLGVGENGKAGVRVGWAAVTAVLVLFAVWFPIHLQQGWPWEG